MPESIESPGLQALWDLIKSCRLKMRECTVYRLLVLI